MSISSEVGIYNLALNAVGERSNISLTTENSRQAEVCRLWYEPVLELVLAAAHWPEISRIAYLAELAERTDAAWVETDPRPGYQFVYSLPADCIRPRYLTDFSRFLVTYYGNNQRALHTNVDTAALLYSAKITNVSLFDPTLRMAIVYALAAHIVMPLTGKPQRAKSLIDRANDFIIAARENAANTSDEQFEHLPDWIRERGYAQVPDTRFVYPYGALLSTASLTVS